MLAFTEGGGAGSCRRNIEVFSTHNENITINEGGVMLGVG